MVNWFYYVATLRWESRLGYSYGVYGIVDGFERVHSIQMVICFYSQISNPSIVYAEYHNELLRILWFQWVKNSTNYYFIYDRRNIVVPDNHAKFYPYFEFLDKLVKAWNIKFHYNRPVTAQLIHADGRPWQKAIVDFRIYAYAANKIFHVFRKSVL